MRNSTLYTIAGPRTFRLGSRKILSKWGANLQNIEKGMREIYHADGYCDALYEKCKYFLQSFDLAVFTEQELTTLRILTQEDQSGAEALIVAYCCRDGNYRQLFKNGIKPHSYLAMILFADIWPKKMLDHRLATSDSGFDINELIDTPIPQLCDNPWWKPLDKLIKDSDNWPIDQRYYYLSKQTEHSSNYDIKPPMFRMNVLEKSGGKIVISKDDSERFLRTKFSLFPEIQDYHRWVADTARKNKVLYNLHGHPYTLTCSEVRESQLKELYALIPQSTVGEITNIAYTNFQEYIEQENKLWDLLANTHDSYLKQCPLTDALECSKKGQEFLGQSFRSPIDGVMFTMKSESAVGFNWSSYKKDKNEVGLKPL